MTMRGRRAGSSMPSSRSNSQDAVLLRQQAALQAVGEAPDDALEMGELLVEIGAQARQLVGIAEILGVDDLVELLVLKAL